MKLKELEESELRGRILKQKAEESWNKAVVIWKKKVHYNKLHWYKKVDWSGKYFNDIKNIQMDLLDLEVEEAVKDKEQQK